MRMISYKETKRFQAAIAALERRSATPNPDAQRTAKKILEAVRKRGDSAVDRFARKFGELDPRRRDSLTLFANSFRVPASVLERAVDQVSTRFRDAVLFAANNIRTFAQWQMPQPFLREIAPGVEVGQLIKPLASVGCYVPGGRYPLPSTLLMTVVPAQVAGVKRIAVCSPKPAPETLAAAALLGVEEFYAIGGAHAIAALAFGTQSIAPVLKIVGPGNSFVTAAKQLVANEGVCTIDMLAGPTEALLVSDHPQANAAMLASDLVSQAEHDPETSCILVTSIPKLARSVDREASKQAKQNPIASKALRNNGVILISKDPQQSVQIAARIASEHTSVDDYEAAQELDAAGSVFVGPYSAQAFGDYVSGPNHTLPTGALARQRGGLSVHDFLKLVTVQRICRAGVDNLAPAALELAHAEGLVGHAASIEARLSGGVRA